jgi:hypothetical protein
MYFNMTLMALTQEFIDNTEAECNSQPAILVPLDLDETDKDPTSSSDAGENPIYTLQK